MRADIGRAGRRRNSRRKNRLTKPTVALGVLGVLLLLGAAVGGTAPRGAPPVVIEVEGNEDGVISLLWAGDTFLGDAAEPYLAEHGHGWVFEYLAPLLDADVVIINAEAPMTTLDEPFTPNKLYSYASSPASAQGMKDAGVTALGLGNNHALDQGAEGLTDTMRYAADAGLATFGAGFDDREAERPLILRGPETTIGVVALAKGYGTRLTAGPRRAGTVPFSTASINRGYALAREAGADHVIAFVHWGENYRPEPVGDQYRDAAKFADAGYDLVVGHGPHVAQKVDVIHSMPVLYSLGNFVFGTPGSYSEKLPGYGLLLETEFTAMGLAAMRITCVDVDNQRVVYQPQACNAPEARKVLGGLGAPALIDGATATVQLPPT